MIDSKALEAAWNEVEASIQKITTANAFDIGRAADRLERARVKMRLAMFAATSPAAEIAGKLADANLKIGQTGVTQEGVEYVVVPKEPTEAQFEATVNERRLPRILDFTTPEERGQAFLLPRYIYRAMTSPSALSANGGK